MTRPSPALLGSLALAAAVATPGLWGGGVDVPDDALYYTVPAWDWMKHALGHGLSPWYVPGKLGGVSLFADVVPQGPFYPGILFAILLPTVLGLGITSLLHACGTVAAVRWLARLRGASEGAACLAGAAVAAGPLGLAAAVDAQADAWPTFLWLPVVLGCMERLSSSSGPHDRRRWIALGAGGFALLILGSHLRVAAGAGAALGLWALLRGRDIRATFALLALGAAAGAPGFVPMLLESRIDGGGSVLASLAAPTGQALGWTAIPEWLAPRSFLVDRGVSLGAVLGLCLLAGRPTREDTRLLLWAAVLLLAGSRVPGARWLLAPLVALTHPVDLVYAVLATVPLALLAARGFDRLLTTTRVPPGLLWGGSALLALAGLRWLLLPDSFHSEYAHNLAAGALLQAGLTSAAVVGILRRPGRGKRAGLLVTLALLDLALFGLRGHLAVPARPLRSASSGTFVAQAHLDIEELAQGWDSTLADAQSEAADALLSREATLEAGATRDEVEADVVVPEVDGPTVQAALIDRRVPPHQGVATGVFGLAGRSKLPPRRQLEALAPLSEAVHDVRAREYVLQALFADPDGLGARTAALHGVERAFWSGVVAYELPPGAPPCYSPAAVRSITDPAERVRALYAQPFSPAGPALGEADVSVGGAAAVTCSDDLVTARAGSPALVVRRVRWHPGWRVEDGAGKALDTLPVNQVHTGVLVPAGEHALRWRFVPPGLHGSLLVAAAAWLILLLLGWRHGGGAATEGGRSLGRARPGASSAPAIPKGLALLWAAPALGGILAAGMLLGATAAEAGAIHGRVEGWSERADYSVLLVTDLDLTEPGQPIATATVQAGGSFELRWTDPPGGEAWLFLDQRIAQEDGPPLRLLRPLDLAPFSLSAPPSPVTLRGVPPGMAILRASGRPLPAPWLGPAVLALLLFGGGLLLRWAIRYRLAAAEGARRLRAVLRGDETAGGPLRLLDHRAAPLASSPDVPVTPPERRALAGILGLALAVRLPGFTAPLELLEHTYGPGSRPLGGGAAPLAERLILALWRPSSVEVTHPPLYHWLLGPLDSHEALLRLPALVFSLATVVCLWLLFRRVSRGAGLAAALGLAVAAPAVHFGHDATPYALVGLVATGSLVLLLRALRTGGVGAWRAWAGTLALGFLCHYMVGLFALAQGLALAVILSLRLRGRAWLGASHRAIGAVLLVAPLPLLWLVVHSAWFGPVALDTRLFADTYPADPGLPAFLSTFAAVSAGVAPDQPIAAAGLWLLAGAGLVAVLRRDRVLGMLLLAMVGGFVGSLLFLHQNLVRHLDGRIFWGFRWVAWFLPLVIGLGAAGLFGADPPPPGDGPTRLGPARHRGHLGRALAGLVAALWLFATAGATLRLDSLAPHPDYRRAAEIIGSDLQDRDALAVLPHWSQRGPLAAYIARSVGGAFGEAHGLDAWLVDGKALLIEAVDERLPTETSLHNSHVERWWLAVADERVFGRAKFSPDVAARALAAAQRSLEPDGHWALDDLDLYRFVARRAPAPRRITAPEFDLASTRWLAPNAETCRAEEEGGERRWWLQVRVPGRSEEAPMRVRHGELRPEQEAGAWQVLGGPCEGPAPELLLE